MKMRARRGAFGMVVVELAPIAQPHVLLPQPRASVIHDFTAVLGEHVHLWREDMLIPRSPLAIIKNITDAPPVAKPKPQPELTPTELRKMKEYEAMRESQPWGWTSAMGLFGGNSGRVYMSVTGPRWRCCGNRFEEEHSPWCSIEGFTTSLPDEDS